MSALSRIIALEQAYGRKAQAPEWWEVQDAQNRQRARDRRALRARAEEVTLTMSFGLPVEFNEETGEILGLPDLWRPFTIEEEGSLLRDQYGTEAQAAKDREIIRRWRVAEGLGPAVVVADLFSDEPSEVQAASTDDYERQLQQEARRIASQFGLDVDEVLERAEQFAEGLNRLRGHLERKVAGNGGA